VSSTLLISTSACAHTAEWKKISDDLRKERLWRDWKKRKVARDLRLAADAKAQGKLDEYQKIRTKNIEVADAAVGILITGGLGEYMKKKKGKK
jgi:hypothetical protein